jgi:hypothetical protein
LENSKENIIRHIRIKEEKKGRCKCKIEIDAIIIPIAGEK